MVEPEIPISGSPPHTRGQGQACEDGMAEVRITPAHAGTRKRRTRIIPRSEDHPRTRGDKWANSIISSIEIGSPPHTRGQGSRAGKRLWWMRITPAHAGTSWPLCWAARLSRDHPRTRGDKAGDGSPQRSGVGSPPHTRGQDLKHSTPEVTLRITPAHAGTRFAIPSAARL